MKMSRYMFKNRSEFRRKAITLYRTGLSLRQVAKALNKSHEWVREAVKEEGVDNFTS